MLRIWLTVTILAAVATLSFDYARTKYRYSEVRSQLARTEATLQILSDASAKTSARTVELERALQEISNVVDNEDCSSPVLDRAFELLRDGNGPT